MSASTAKKRAHDILRQLRDAIANGDDTDDLEDDFLDAREGIVDSEIRVQFDTAWQKVIQAEAEEAFRAYGKAVASIRPLADGFALGSQVAADGQRDLFFPAAAAYLGQISSILQELKTAADEVIDNVDEVRDGIGGAENAFRKGDVVGLIDAGEEIRKLLLGDDTSGEDGLLAKLGSIRSGLNN